MSLALNRLAQRILKLEKDLAGARTPQLGLSSIDYGSLDVTDPETGEAAVKIGQQFDGTFAITPVIGPPPPVPSGPIVEPMPGALIVRWDGTFADGSVSPMDFARVEVHASTSAGFLPSMETLRGTIDTALGGEVAAILPSGVLHYVKLVARSHTGKASEPSLEAAETPVTVGVDQATLDRIDADVADAKAAAEAVSAEVDGIPAMIEAAKQSAIDTAATDAEGKAAAAQSAAVSAAAADAAAKAAAAQSAATTAAAADAQSKANAAKAAAEAAAKTYSDTVASGAKSEAISAAAADAKAKADAAEAAAKAAAAADATAKADAAQAAAIASAATTAQNKADLAEAAAINSAQSYVQSRGTNLVTNGSGLLGDNTNFSLLAYTKADAPPGITGSFRSALGSTTIPQTDELIPVDPSKKLRLSFQARQLGTTAGGYMYAFVAPYDSGKQAIDPGHYMFVAGTTTTLAADLKNGDTTITLTAPPTAWYGSAGKNAGTSIHLRRMIVWDYVDAGGRAWPAETYSRNVTATDLWADGGITGNVITLRAPWAGGLKPAGTKVSNGSSGGTFMYGAIVNGVVPKEWTKYAESIVGTAGGAGASFAAGWPPGTAYAKVGWLVNRTVSGPADAQSQHAIAGISFGDAEAAAYDANNITETQITTDAITTPKIKAGAIISGKIASDAILANHIKAGEIVAGKLAADAVLATNIAADAVLARNIKAGEITADKLKAGTITAASGVIGDLDAAKITVGKITAAQMATGTITAASGVIGSIDASKITTGTLSAINISGTNITGATMKTVASGRRIEIGTTAGEGLTSAGSMVFYNGHAAEGNSWATPPSVFADTSVDTDGTHPVLSIRSGYYGQPNGTPNVPPNGALFHSSYIMLHGSASGENTTNPPDLGSTAGPHIYMGPYLRLNGGAYMNGLTVDGDIKSMHTTGSYNRTRSPGAVVRKTVATSTNNATYTLMSFNGHMVAGNEDSTVWSSAQPSRFYAPASGRYSFGGNIVWAANSTGYRIAALRMNSAGASTGGSSITYWTCEAVTGTATSLPVAFTDLYMQAGDYVEVFTSQASGAALNVGTANGIVSTFTMTWIGPV